MNDARSAEIESLVQRWAGLIRKAALRYGLLGADYDEVVQDVRIRIWRALERAERQPEPLSPGYGYRAAVSAAVDLVRRRRSAGPGRQVGLEEVEPVIADPSSGAGSAEGSQLLDALERALLEVPESRRPAVRLHLSGRHLDEITRVMGWSRGKARNLLYRGLADLKTVLQREGGMA